jgi:hypothetical protein
VEPSVTGKSAALICGASITCPDSPAPGFVSAAEAAAVSAAPDAAVVSAAEAPDAAVVSAAEAPAVVSVAAPVVSAGEAVCPLCFAQDEKSSEAARTTLSHNAEVFFIRYSSSFSGRVSCQYHIMKKDGLDCFAGYCVLEF